LALALGAQATLQLEDGKKACLLLSLPLEASSDSPATRQKDPALLSSDQNGHERVARNGSHSHNGKAPLLVETA
jgi:hypothetical protein